MIKKTLIISIILYFFSLQYSIAQRFNVANLQNYDNKKYHFGFVLGLNKMYFSVKPKADINEILYTGSQIEDLTCESGSCNSARLYSVESNPTTGFNIGIVSNLKLGKYFDLRFIPSLAFGERELEYSILIDEADAPEEITVIKKISSTFVDFPLEIKFKSQRYNNARAYVMTGVKYTLDLASQANKKQDITQYKLKLYKNDFSLELGVGFDFYTPYFKFGTELKMSYGLNDMLKYEDSIYTGGISSLRSKVFLLSFTFE